MIWQFQADASDGSKPDLFLLPCNSGGSLPSLQDIFTTCEVRHADDSTENAAVSQMLKMATMALTSQCFRRFYIGMSLFGPMCRIGIFTRSLHGVTAPFDIDVHPLLFIRMVLVVSLGHSSWVGLDENLVFTPEPNHFILPIGPFSIMNRSVLSRSPSVLGSGMQVLLAVPSLGRKEPYIIEDYWMQASNNHSSKLLPMSSIIDTQEEREVFGPTDTFSIFHGCLFTEHWDHKSNFPGIPVLAHSEVVTCSLPNHQGDLEHGEDTTERIFMRFNIPDLPHESLKHIRALFTTCAIPIVWFTCKRELINAFMGAIAGKNHSSTLY